MPLVPTNHPDYMSFDTILLNESYRGLGASSAVGRSRAFATLVCDDASVLSAAVLIMSLLRTGTSASVVPMLAPAVSLRAEAALARMALSVTPVRVPEVPYPFKVHQAEMHRGLKRSCRYTKLHAWSLVSFERVILLDSDMLVMEPLDDIFSEAQRLAAVADIYPRIFNTGLLVIAPDAGTHARLVAAAGATFSYNEGDQGFLNSYFEEHPHDAFFESGSDSLDTSLPWQPLDAKYNYAMWVANSLYGKRRFPNAEGVAVAHFSGEIKPWFFGGVGGLRVWERFYEPQLFLRWWRLADEAAKQLGCAGHMADRPAQMHQTNSTRLCGINMCHNTSDPRSCRSPVCEVLAPHFQAHHFEQYSATFTVVLSTFRGKRIPIETLCAHYANSSYVGRIVVVWHDPATPPPKSPSPRRVLKSRAEYNHTVLVTTLWQANDSLNNRFPAFEVTTRHVLICDDDIIISLDDLAFAFEVANQNPKRLISPFVRAHHITESKDTDRLLPYLNGYFEHDATFPQRGFRRYSMVR